VRGCDGFSGFVKVYRFCCWFSWISEGKGGPGLSVAVVRDLREARVPAGPDELAAFETDVLAGFVLGRAAAGLSDNTIRSDVLHLLRDASKGTRLARSQALRTYFGFLEGSGTRSRSTR
jgi:hypothetical protein